MFWKITRWSFVMTGVALVLAGIYGAFGASSPEQMITQALGAVWICFVLGVMEVSLSFDNAVINAGILQKMSPFWQKMFLTVGILIAVVGMRLIFPLIIVCIASQMNIGDVFSLAMQKGDPETPGTYGYILNEAHPMIAAFGGMFLLLMFLDFVFEDREIKWLSWLERPLAKIGQLDKFAILVALGALMTVALLSSEHERLIILFSGLLGIMLHIGVKAFSDLMERNAEKKEHQLAANIGKAGLGLFLYLELLDATLSFDGAIGAFAITADIILIALGLGLIGSMFVRSLTVYLVRAGSLKTFVHLEHGAYWAIGALAVILLVSISVEVSELITGLIGIAFIGTAFFTSWRSNKRAEAEQAADEAALAEAEAAETVETPEKADITA